MAYLQNTRPCIEQNRSWESITVPQSPKLYTALRANIRMAQKSQIPVRTTTPKDSKQRLKN